MRIDGNRSGHILELRPDQRQSGFVFSDRRFPLILKRSVDQRKLPPRRRFAGPDAILTSIKMHVLSDVATIVNPRKTRADVKIHVRQKAMLCVMSAYSHSAWISRLNFKVDVADCGIERSWVRIGWRVVGMGTRAREEHHISGPLLKTRRVCRKHESGPRFAKADQPNSRPDINSLSQTIAASRNEQNALIRLLLNRIDGLLQDGGIICDSITFHWETILRKINCSRIVQAGCVVGAGEQRNHR